MNPSNPPTTERTPASVTVDPAHDARQLVISRLIAAPPHRVFDVWTKQLPSWWGPHGVTTRVLEMDLRPGGVFCTVMHGPDGTQYPTQGVFLEVLQNERIVFTDAFAADWMPSPSAFFTAIVSFQAHHGHTKYTVRALHWTVANCDKHKNMGFHQGWAESCERLSLLVASRKNHHEN